MESGSEMEIKVLLHSGPRTKDVNINRVADSDLESARGVEDDEEGVETARDGGEGSDDVERGEAHTDTKPEAHNEPKTGREKSVENGVR